MSEKTTTGAANLGMPWYPLFHRDFTIDTIDWPNDAIGMLMRLMNYQWQNEFLPINQKRLAVIAMCQHDPDRWGEMWKDYLSHKFTEAEPGKLVNNRMRKEYIRICDRNAKASAFARKRWGKPEKDAIADAKAHPITDNRKQTKDTHSPTVRVPCQKIVDLYHEHCPDLPRVKVLSEKRKQAIRTRWKNFEFIRGVGKPGAAMELHKFNELDTWERYFKFITKHCSFMAGNNERNWTANFDFCIRESGMINVLENKYVDRKP